MTSDTDNAHRSMPPVRLGDRVMWNNEEWMVSRINRDSSGSVYSLILRRPGVATCVSPRDLSHIPEKISATKTNSVLSAIEALNDVNPGNLAEANTEHLIELARYSQLTFSAAMLAATEKLADARIALAEQRKAEEASH